MERQAQLERIAHYEALLDKAADKVAALRRAIDGFGAAQGDLSALSAYYSGDAWKQDFADDEAGRLPADLKRGVLSEDALFSLLEEAQTLKTALRDLL